MYKKKKERREVTNTVCVRKRELDVQCADDKNIFAKRKKIV